jgi:hypothetical protein
MRHNVLLENNRLFIKVKNYIFDYAFSMDTLTGGTKETFAEEKYKEYTITIIKEGKQINYKYQYKNKNIDLQLLLNKLQNEQG